MYASHFGKGEQWTKATKQKTVFCLGNYTEASWRAAWRKMTGQICKYTQHLQGLLLRARMKGGNRSSFPRQLEIIPETS